jgi:hypothetical protein
MLVDLRDYFAGKAMQGLLVAYKGDITLDEVAEAAYEMADAMLRQRAHEPSSWPGLPTNTTFMKE